MSLDWRARLPSLPGLTEDEKGSIYADLLRIQSEGRNPEEYFYKPLSDTAVVAALKRAFLQAPAPGQSYESIPGTQEELVFWKNLEKAKLNSVPVSINQDADEMDDMEVDEIPGNQVLVTILELQDNSTFMGVQGGMSSIMVPEFYNDLWEKAERLIDKNTGRKGMVITGTPGTGKSVMGWYFIYKLRMKLGSFDLVYQHQRSAKQTLYSKDGTVTSAETAAGSFRRVLSSKDTVYVVDGAGVLDENAMTFVFASPHPRGYNEFLKGKGRVLYYSKVWSKIEILAARKLLYKDIKKSLVLDLYRKWGGVPRHVLEKAEDSNWQTDLLSKIESVSGDDWLDFMTKVGGQGCSEISDVIFHFRTEGYVRKTVVFASFYVSELAYTALEKGAWVKTVDFLGRDDPTSAAFRGQLFSVQETTQPKLNVLNSTGPTSLHTLRINLNPKHSVAPEIFTMYRIWCYLAYISCIEEP